jgi:putative oxidoreductase
MISPYQSLNSYFEKRNHFSAIFIRVIVGFRLIYGSADNVFSWERMIEFKNFLQQLGTPFPLLSANVSVYAQFICGILYIVGLWIRPAAMIMIANFICAIIIAHLDSTFLETFDAWMMLFASLFLLFHGAGKLSVENLLHHRK